MKKAIIVTAYHKVEMLNIFLTQLLEDAETDIYIHVDKKSNITKDIISDPRIIHAEKQYEINWGSDELLKAILSLYRQIIRSGIEYKYVIVTTGQDLVVRKGLDAFLLEHDGQVFIDSMYSEEMDRYKRAVLMHKWPEIYKKNYSTKYHPVRVARSLRISLLFKLGNHFEKKVNYDVDKIKFYYDRHWNAMPIEVVKWIIDYIDSNPEYWKIFDGAFMCEEAFFTTTIMMGPYADRIKLEDNKSTSLTFRKKSSDNNHPAVLSFEDIHEIEASGCFFARKFDLSVDSKVIDYFVNQKAGSSY